MDNKMYKEFLELELQWSKNQMAILDEMENKLQEMKKIAKIAVANDLSMNDRKSLNDRMQILKHEYNRLEKQENSVIH